MRVLGVIPARLKSVRVPEKAIVDICGMPMVVHVLHRARMANCLDDVIVATDSEQICDIVASYGGTAEMTSESHRNPSERLAEIAERHPADVYVLINGDEPLVRPEDIDLSLKTLIEGAPVDASALYVEIEKFASPSDFKVVLNKDSEAMYISRGDIPSPAKNKVDTLKKVYHVMSFWRQTLLGYPNLPKPLIEDVEEHEHIRMLFDKQKIRFNKVDYLCFSVDTMEDLAWVRDAMVRDDYFQIYGKQK